MVYNNGKEISTFKPDVGKQYIEFSILELLDGLGIKHNVDDWHKEYLRRYKGIYIWNKIEHVALRKYHNNQ